MSDLKPGVGYVLPLGDLTADGWPIDPAIIVPEKAVPNIADIMRAKFGPEWQRGKAGVGTVHSSDHDAWLREAWERGQRGIDLQGLLVNNGHGYDGNPTQNEIAESHRGVKSRTQAIVARVVPGAPGYGVEPLDTSRDPEAHERQQWSTEQWRSALTEGNYQDLPPASKDRMFAQLDLIESGGAEGWARNKAGKWRPDPTTRITQAESDALNGLAGNRGHVTLAAVEAIGQAQDLMARAIRLINAVA